ncbi:hypothetical protein PSE10A_54010 [Pseudomonas amygdali pv. eriobotryae]|uniref:Uncharacterized protein n=1 Tax=Pseudomonas amygdali pv. eriobotryae TaxID=129137 RepID=A0A9P3AJG9_PSEA0|nr:hypothetical protein PSE10A_54010 [Pseudomonas amygdali pv. eriobotryae]
MKQCVFWYGMLLSSDLESFLSDLRASELREMVRLMAYLVIGLKFAHLDKHTDVPWPYPGAIATSIQ